MTLKLLAPVALALGLAAAAHAQDAGPTPTPAAAPADAESSICTDRPTKVYATCTVDPGKLQLEADIANGSFLRLDGVTTDTWLATNPTLKYGVAKTLDVEANLAPYEVVRTHDAEGTSTVGGVGDLYLRAKWALYSGKAWSVSVVPYVKAPIAREGIGNGAWEGGSAVAIGYKINDVWTLSLAPELDAYEDASGDGRHLNHIEVVNLGRSLPNNVTVYGELWGDWNFDPTGTVRQYSADFAVAWGVTKSLQLDAGVNLGLNRYTPGAQGYVGVSKRF